MKKNDLIKILQDLKGNPEVVLWNGFVGDYMHIKGLEEGDLVKQALPFYTEMCEHGLKKENDSFDYEPTPAEQVQIKVDYKRYINWETNPYVTLDEIKAGRYIKKRIVYINAKPRGVKTFDRAGGIEY